MRSLATIMAVLAVLILATPALASTVGSGGPGFAPGDWTQQWQWQGTTVDTVHLFIQTAGVDFANPGVSGFSNSWTAQNINPQYVLMEGLAGTNFLYNTNVIPDISVPFTYDWHGLLNGNEIDTGSGTWSGREWSYGNALKPLAQENMTPTPEPATFGLLGACLAGIGIATRRHKHNKV